MTIFTFLQSFFKRSGVQSEGVQSDNFTDCTLFSPSEHPRSVRSTLRIEHRSVRPILRSEHCSVRLIYINIWGLFKTPHIYIYKKPDATPNFHLSKITALNF